MHAHRFLLPFALIAAGACTSAPQPASRPAAAAPAQNPAPVVAAAPVQRSEPVLAAVSPPAPTVAPASQSRAVTVDAYKREVAEMLISANSDQVFLGRPPAILYGVVVLQYSVDRSGQPAEVKLLRVPSHAPELGKQAVLAFQRAAPFNRPSSNLTNGQQNLVLTESLLFRNDGKFQVRTLAQPQ